MDNSQGAAHDADKSQPHTETYSTRSIFALAIPALGALVIEPTLTFIDSVMVGHLGVSQLAGLAVGAAVMNTLVGIFVFLAYSTTASTAAHIGGGHRTRALETGVHAIWLALGLGIAVLILVEVSAPWLVELLGADSQTLTPAVEYLRFGAPGMVGMLTILAATGTLRGMLDTKTPLYVLAGGAVINVSGNFLFIYGLNLGIIGAGISLSITQTLMACVLVLKVLAEAKRTGASLRPQRTGIWDSARTGIPLLWRTISLRIALLATLSVAAVTGATALAAHQVVMSIWTIASFALDALAIAAQSLVGVAIGAGNLEELRRLVRRLTLWGVCGGVGLGVILVASSPWTPLLFGSDPSMHQIASGALLAAGLCLPIGALVFQLDGILIGAQQGPYLAKMGVLTLVGYLPALGILYWWILHQGTLDVAAQSTVMIWLWIAFSGWFMTLRAGTNWMRARSLGEPRAN